MLIRPDIPVPREVGTLDLSAISGAVRVSLDDEITAVRSPEGPSLFVLFYNPLIARSSIKISIEKRIRH